MLQGWSALCCKDGVLCLKGWSALCCKDGGLYVARMECFMFVRVECFVVQNVVRMNCIIVEG